MRRHIRDDTDDDMTVEELAFLQSGAAKPAATVRRIGEHRQSVIYSLHTRAAANTRNAQNVCRGYHLWQGLSLCFTSVVPRSPCESVANLKN